MHVVHLHLYTLKMFPCRILLETLLASFSLSGSFYVLNTTFLLTVLEFLR